MATRAMVAMSAQGPAIAPAGLVVKNTFLDYEIHESTPRPCRRVRTVAAHHYKNLFGLSDAETEADSASAGSASPAAGSAARGESPESERAAGAEHSASKEAVQQQEEQQQLPKGKRDKRTTVMLRNLPNNYTREMLLEMLDAEGFAGQYNFVYLPVDFKTGFGVGYAFVNLVHTSLVPDFWATFDGYNKWVLPTSKIGQVSWSKPYQGLRANVQRWRNSSVMHESVPEECKPVVFARGVRGKFPRPTRAIPLPLVN